MRVIGISRVDEGRRIYLPRDLFDILNIKGEICFKNVGKHIEVTTKDTEGGIKVSVGTKNRVYVPDEILERLKLEIGSNVIFLQEGGKVTLSRLEDRIR